MYGNDESHKRAARRRLQRLALAAALVASTSTTTSAIDPPVTQASASEAVSPSMPPLPVNIGRLGTGAPMAAGIVPSAVKGIRQNPFLIPPAVPDGVVARVSGTDAEVDVVPDSTPRLLRPTAPVLSLRPIALPAELSADEPMGEDSSGEAPQSRGARFTLADTTAPTTAHTAPSDDRLAPSSLEDAPSSPADDRVSFAISDDGVRATVTLGQPADAPQSEELLEHRAADQPSEPAPELGMAQEIEEPVDDDQIPRLPSRRPRIMAAAAPEFDLDLSDAQPEAVDGLNEEVAAGPQSILDVPEPVDAPLAVASDASGSDEAAEQPATATLARPSARISAIADRQPVVIAKPATPVARRLPGRQTETAASAPASSDSPTSSDSPPDAKLAKPNRTLVIDAPAGRSVAHVGGAGFELPQLPSDSAGSMQSAGDQPVGSEVTAGNEVMTGNESAASELASSESAGAGERAAAAGTQTAVAEAILIQSAETRTITPAEPVRRVRLEDREICEAVLVGPHKLLLIGRRDGTTRLSVWSSDHREPALYEVTVVSRQAAPGQSPLLAVAERLTETIAATYPRCHVQIVPDGDGLKVRGRVDSADSAKEIMRLVRRACLKSVTDNLEIR